MTDTYASIRAFMNTWKPGEPAPNKFSIESAEAIHDRLPGLIDAAAERDSLVREIDSRMVERHLGVMLGVMIDFAGKAGAMQPEAEVDAAGEPEGGAHRGAEGHSHG